MCVARSGGAMLKDLWGKKPARSWVLESGKK